MGRAQRNPSPVERRANPSPVERRGNPSPVERRGNPSSVGRESDGFRRWLYPSYGDLQERPFDRLRTGFSREFLRSVEHTSELQSLMRISYAVFGLKKKQQKPTARQPLTH